MKQKNPIKRLAINLVAILIIGAVAFLANRSYSASTSKGPTLDQIDDLPKLSTMKIVEAKVDDDKVQAAIEIVGEDESAIVADFLSLYQWGRSYFRPVKCGEEYPPNLCQIGEVHIFILTYIKDVPSTAGPVGVPLIKAEIWLDQFQIDILLGPDTTIQTFSDLVEFHSSAAQKNGGGVGQPDEIFTDLK